MENKKFLMVFLVFFIALLMYQQFYALPKAQEAKAKQEALVSEQAVTATKSNSSITKTVLTPSDKQVEEKFYDFSTKTADIKFTSKGAGIKDYIFKDCVGDVNLTPYTEEGFYTTFPGLTFKEAGRTDNSITFTVEEGYIRINKTYTFNDDGINNLSLSIENRSTKEQTLDQFYFNFGPGIGTVESEKSDNSREMKAVYITQEEGKKFPTFHNRSKEKIEDSVKDGNWIWAGLNNRYFLAVLIPQNWKSGLLETEKVIVDSHPRFFGLLGKAKVEGPALKITVPAMSLPPKSKTVLQSDFYFGPKDYKTFQTMPYSLDKSIEFGFFGALGKMVRWVLETLYRFTGNYGVAIIILAVLFQITMLRLTVMQHKSSMVMQKIQPEMKSIQERYKNDQTAQQQAMLALYKKHKFNPFMGCLPLLIQLPIFIALFNAFRTSWELHGAEFVWWITDLSAKDPFYVLPIVMGGVMFIQQRITAPVGSDPAQTAMLKWMPVIFTFVFINFPAGLVLYWLTNSIISLGIQLYMKRKMAKA